MTFLGLVARNLARHRSRSALTLLGISLGITTVVALGVVTAGLKETANAMTRAGGADFMVAQEGSADLSFSRVPEETVADIEAQPGVASARGIFLHIVKVGSNPFFMLMGETPADLAAQAPDLIAGRLLLPGAPDEVVLGSKAASDLGVGVGDDVEIADARFRVVGIFSGGGTWERAGGYAPLARVQELARSDGAVTIVYVNLEPGADPTEAARAIETAVPDVVVVTGSGDYAQVDQGFTFLDAANRAISFLAVLIGGIGVTNTMVMSIFERTREIGVLRAVGWSGPRVVRVIITESVLLCILAAAVGSGLGVLAAIGVTRMPAVAGFLVPAYPVDIFVRAVIVALVVGLVGAAYPAVRAARLTPMDALRYE